MPRSPVAGDPHLLADRTRIVDLKERNEITLRSRQRALHATAPATRPVRP